MSDEQALARARLSLDGLSLGDALGGFFEMSTRQRMEKVIQERRLPDVQWHFTDDTNMALSIYENLRRYGEINQDELAKSFVIHFDRLRGYGPGMRTFAHYVSQGMAWHQINVQMFSGGSFGNGGAMRIAPLG
ncbi:MAG TPA: ADP-ribosylglycohydrolase family protein, partial [Aggregatilineales bacterium]|nr:ADP-ribosylglycohydrolase family protein [Aggregatilineales bacterium]